MLAYDTRDHSLYLSHVYSTELLSKTFISHTNYSISAAQSSSYAEIPSSVQDP